MRYEGSSAPSAAGSREPPKVSSTLQAILHRGGGGMETIVVPLPLPDVVIRVDTLEAPPPERSVPHAGAERAVASYRDLLFRRVRSSDSVVRYYEHEDGIAGELARGAEAPRLCGRCGRCGHRGDCFFVKAMPMDALLTPEVSALCIECYAESGAVSSSGMASGNAGG